MRKKRMLCLVMLIMLLVNIVNLNAQASSRVITLEKPSPKTAPAVKLPTKGKFNLRANRQSRILRRLIKKDGWRLVKVKRKGKRRIYTYKKAEISYSEFFRITQKVGKKSSTFKLCKRYYGERKAIREYKKGHYIIYGYYASGF